MNGQVLLDLPVNLSDGTRVMLLRYEAYEDPHWSVTTGRKRLNKSVRRLPVWTRVDSAAMSMMFPMNSNEKSMRPKPWGDRSCVAASSFNSSPDKTSVGSLTRSEFGFLPNLYAVVGDAS